MSDEEFITSGEALRALEELAGTEFTSAALRRAEQERDKALAAYHQAKDMWGTSRQAHELTLAELASARQELDAVRTARDNLGRELALAHREVLELDAQIKLCPRCSVEVDAEVAAEMDRDTPTGGTT